jgi:hypothetical protein
MVAEDEERTMNIDDLFQQRCDHLGISEDAYWELVRSSVIRGTLLLRSSIDAADVQVAHSLGERGIDLETAVVPRYHEDGDSELFGVVVTQSRSAYVFCFSWAEGCLSPAGGSITEWENLTEDWKQSIYAEDVFHGLRALYEGWIDAPM